MLIAGAILCPDDYTPQQYSFVEAAIETLHEIAIDPVMVVSPQRLAQHPSIKNRYERFGAFGSLMSALMWTKATPIVTIPSEVSPLVLESFAAQLCGNDFGLAQQSCDENLLLVASEYGDVAHIGLNTKELEKVLTVPVLWPPNFGSSVRKLIKDL